MRRGGVGRVTRGVRTGNEGKCKRSTCVTPAGEDLKATQREGNFMTMIQFFDLGSASREALQSIPLFNKLKCLHLGNMNLKCKCNDVVKGVGLTRETVKVYTQAQK